MAHTYTSILVHIVFSTKERTPLLKQNVRSILFPYMSGIVTNLRGKAFIINGVEDHVHMLVATPAAISIAKFVGTVKANSTGWINEQRFLKHRFAWQTGYGAFSVSHLRRNIVYKYIATQEEHHRKKTFKEEFIGFLKAHHIEYDDRYIWD